jgi:GMP synthase-like glutamine amidotransferase
MIPVSDMHTLLLHLHPSSQSLARELYIIDSNVLARSESCCGLRYAVDGAAEAASVVRDICFGLQRERRCAGGVVAQRSQADSQMIEVSGRDALRHSAVVQNILTHGAMASQTVSGRQSDD